MNEKPQNKLFVFTLVMLSLCLLVSAVAANIIQVPNSNVNTIGGITSVNLMLDEAPDGFAGYSINVSVSDPSIATITDVTFPSWAAMKDNTSLPSPSCKISAVDLNEQINARATSIPLATLSLKGLKSGSTPLVVTLNRMNNDADGRMYPTVQSSTFTVSVAPVSTQSIIANHTSGKLSTVPKTAIEQAKSKLHIAYGHTSHGSQITDGMNGLTTFAGAPYGGELYKWNNGGTLGALDLEDGIPGASDLGAPDYTTWATATRNYLNTHSDVNVIMWSWCGQADTSAENINTYLSLMNQLELDYPNVKFVYMTGHLVGTGTNGNLNLRNEQIRAYARDNNKILFDFADIESYDPDGLVNYMELNADDGCNYQYGGTKNWAIDWQNTHTQGVDWYLSGAAHTQPLNANMKAYAAWWMWARLSGWDGSTNPINPVPSITGISPSTTIAGEPAFTLTVDGSNFVSGSLVRVNGASRTTTYVSPVLLTAAIPASDIATARAVNISVFNPAPGGGLSANTTLVISNPIPKTGNISVTSVPVGASIKLDGTSTGKISPYTFNNQNAGAHIVEISLAGYKPASQTVTVAVGTTVTADFQLEAIPTTGSISVTSVPVGASIKLDGTSTGKITPYTFDNQNSGAHTVEVSLAGYKPASKTVTVVVGTTVNADFQLEAIVKQADLSLTKTVSKSTAVTGEEVSWTITLTNNGPDAAQNIVIADAFSGFTVMEIKNIIPPTVGTVSGTTLSGTNWVIPSMDSGQSAQAIIVCSFTSPGTKTNTVSIKSVTTSDPVLSNNTASASVTIVKPTGTIAVTSAPVGASIKLDGTDTGKITPYTFDNQNVGAHTVEASLAGYKPASKTVTVAVGTIVNAEFPLEAIPTTGSIAVSSVPVGASIKLDGTDTGKITPYTFDTQNAGAHTVEVSLAGYKPASQPVTVAVGKTVNADFKLETLPTTGSIAVTSAPVGAAIKLDGTDTGKITPYTFDTQNAGAHTVEISLAGYKPASQPVTVAVGKTVIADFKLEAVVKQADLALTKTVSKSTAITGEEVNWTITITNNGPDAAQNIIIADDYSGLSGGAIKSVAQPTIGTISGTTWTIPALEKGQTAKMIAVSSFTTTGKKINVVRIQSAGTPDPVQSNNVASAYVTIVEKPANAPKITKVSPASGEVGKIIQNLYITGDKFQQGATVKLQRMGQTDLVPTNVVVANAGQIICTLTIPQTTDVGAWDVVVSNPDSQFGIKPAAFSVTAPNPPKVMSVNPSTGTAGSPDRVLVLYGSDFVDGAKVSLQMTGQSDIAAKRSVVFGSRYIIAIVDLPTGAEPGQWDVTVTNPDGQRGTKEKSYTIKSVKGPTVRSIEPSTAKAGQTSIVATIRGAAFVSGASVTLQKMNKPDIAATDVYFLNSGQLACVINLPADAVPGLYDVVVTNPDLKSGKKESGFKITNATIIPTLTPTPTPTKTPMPTPTPSTTYPAAQVTGKIDGDKIQLNWNAITDTRLQGYKVVVSKSNANPKYPEDGYMFWITDRNQNHATVDSQTSYNGGDINGKLKAGEKYYFSITAVYGDAKVPGNVVQLVFPGTATVTPTPPLQRPTRPPRSPVR